MLSTSRIWKPAPPAPREPRETVWVSAKPGEREDAESRERWLAAAGELDGGGEEERARVVPAGETGMAEGGGGEEARKDLEGWLGAAMMFWVVGTAAGEGGVFWRAGPLLWAGAWLGGEAWAGGRGSRALLLRLAASGGGGVGVSVCDGGAGEGVGEVRRGELLGGDAAQFLRGLALAHRACVGECKEQAEKQRWTYKRQREKTGPGTRRLL